jgi:hypothetical protein
LTAVEVTEAWKIRPFRADGDRAGGLTDVSSICYGKASLVGWAMLLVPTVTLVRRLVYPIVDSLSRSDDDPAIVRNAIDKP